VNRQETIEALDGYGFDADRAQQMTQQAFADCLTGRDCTVIFGKPGYAPLSRYLACTGEGTWEIRAIEPREGR
jgi:hypothetical protein